MTKKNAPKKTAKKAKAEQLKIEGTGRTDAIDELDKAGEQYRAARDARMEMQEDESSAQELLTGLLKKHGRTDYTYEGSDGKLYKASLAEAKAKVKRVTEPKAKAN
jgi:hypothetical protein